MANRDNPCGFIPVQKLDGSKIPEWTFPVNSVGSNMFVGDLVYATSDGDIDVAAADQGDAVVGAVTAIYDENMTPIGHPNSTVSTKYLPSGDTGYAKVALALPDAIFRVQSDSGTNVSETSRWQTANHVAGTGNTTTGISAHELDASDIGTGAQLKILDKVDEPNNAWGDAHVDLLVIISESWFYDATAGV